MKFPLITLILFLNIWAAEITIVTENQPPLQFTQNGIVTDGLSFDLINSALKKLNINTQINSYPWARSYNLALTEENVLIFSLTRTKEREDLFKWIDTIHILEDYLWALKDNLEIKGKITPEEIKKFKTAVQRDDQQYFFLKEWGLTENAGLVVVPTQDLALKMLYAKRVDFIMESDILMDKRAESNGFDPNKLSKCVSLGKMGSGLFFAFSKQTSDTLVNEFINVFKEMRKSGEYEKIKKKWIK